MFDHDIWIVEVAAIEDDGITKRLVEPVEIEGGEGGPVGEDEEGVSVVGRGIRAVDVAEIGTGGKSLLSALDGCGIVGSDGAALGEEHLDEVNCRRLADVVGLTFEGEAENADALAAKIPEGRADFVEEAPLLLAIYLFDFGEEIEVDTHLLGDGTEGGDILGKTGSAITDAWTEKLWSDAAVEAHAAGDLLYVGVGGFAEVRHGVDEGDFEGKEGVGGVLDDLGALCGGEEERRGLGAVTKAGDGVAALVVFPTGEGKIDSIEDGSGSVTVGTDDDAVGMEEVGDGCSFAEELGIGDDVEEVPGGSVALHRTGNPLVGVDGNGALFDDDFVTGEGTGDLAGDGFDVGEIGVARLALRSAYSNEDGFALAGGFGEIGHEADFGVAVLFEELRQVVFVDERVAALKSFDFAFVIVHTDDIVAHFGEADGSDQADISRSYDCNFDVFTHDWCVRPQCRG